MKKIAALSALAVVGLAGSAFGVATGNIEFRFVTIAGAGANVNQGTGLANGVVLGPNTVITADNALIRQRIALQVRTQNIAGDYSTQQLVDGVFTPGVVSPAQNLGTFSWAGGINLGDGTLLSGAGLNVLANTWNQGVAGVVAGSSWTNIQRSAGTGTLATQTWPFANPNPPAPANPAVGAGGAWIQVASFYWTSGDVTPRSIAGAFTPIAAGNTALIGNGVPSANLPLVDDEIDGDITYSTVFQVLPTTVNNFSFLIEQGQTNNNPDSLSTPAVITADPFANPDALNLVLASFSDDDNDNITVNVTNDGGIGALGGSVSVSGNGGLAPTIVLNWDAPNAAIGQTFIVDFSYTDGIGDVLTGQTSVQVIPAPGALALLGLGGLVAGRRRRA